jgi:hypothetical protein
MSHRFLPAAAAAGLFLALAAPSRADEPTTYPKSYDDPVLERMRKDLFFLASPECEGRGIDTKGIEKAAAHIADQFKAAGLKPAMKDGSYFQPFTHVVSSRQANPTKLAFAGPNDAAKELKAGTDFNPLGFSSTARANAGIVFAGYGITAPDLKYDDYAGIDVAGKWVIVLRKLPRAAAKGDDRFDKSVRNPDESAFAALQAKVDNAAAHKAAGVIIVNDAATAAGRDQLSQFADHSFGTTPVEIPVVHVKREAIDALVAGGPVKGLADLETLIDKDLKPRSFEVAGWKADGEVTVNRTEYKCKNVVGVLEGSGPLADETVVIGAHYDHLGYGNFGSLGGATARGKIHFGADDNASGTTGLIELARRYGAMKDREGRRLVFVAFSAEERGLYGSAHYCASPPFPLDKTAAMINLDMIGRSKPVPADWLGIEQKDRLVVYGTGTGDTFADLVKSANEKPDFKLITLAGGTGPSDHQSFYLKKVPVLFLFTGTHGEYHRPTDVPEKVNVPAMKKVADYVQNLADHLTTVPTRPKYQATRDPWYDPTEQRAARTTPARPAAKLGVMPGNYEAEDGGVLVDEVSPGGAAEKAGIKAKDVIVEIGGKPVKNIGGYMTAMSAQRSGVPVEVVVLRKGQKMTIKVTPD